MVLKIGVMTHVLHITLSIMSHEQSDEPPPLEDVSGEGPQPQCDPPSEVDPPESDFPLDHLTKLDDQLNRPKWVVPVRADDDLERLLKASIKLCREGAFVYHFSVYCVHTTPIWK